MYKTARCIKHDLRKRLRDRMRQLRKPLEDPYIRLVINFLNLVLGNADSSTRYWENIIKPLISEKFEGFSLPPVCSLILFFLFFFFSLT